MRPLSTVILSTLVASCMLGCGADSKAPNSSANPTVASTPAPKEPTSFGAFSFEVPDQWQSVPPDQAKTKAMLLLGDSNWQNAQGMVKVDVGKAAAPSARELADKAASSMGGKVTDDAPKFDGVEGVRIAIDSQDLMKPREVVIVFHNEQAYLIMIAAKGHVDVAPAFEKIRSTWKWTPDSSK